MFRTNFDEIDEIFEWNIPSKFQKGFQKESFLCCHWVPISFVWTMLAKELSTLSYHSNTTQPSVNVSIFTLGILSSTTKFSCSCGISNI